MALNSGSHYFYVNLCDIIRDAFKKAALKSIAMSLRPKLIVSHYIKYIMVDSLIKITYSYTLMRNLQCWPEENLGIVSRLSTVYIFLRGVV